MNTSPDSPIGKKDETKDNTDFKDKLAKFINPFYVSFVIFWVVCNYDFLLILIGKKAILHELYTHFGYGCGVLNITDDGKIYTNYQLNLFVCVEKSRLAYAGYFLIWKVAIPFGLTWLYITHYYTKFVMPLNHIYNDATNRNLVMEDLQNQLRDTNERLKLLEMQKLKLINEKAEIKDERDGFEKENDKLRRLTGEEDEWDTAEYRMFVNDNMF